VTCQPELGRDEYMFRLMGHRLSFISSPDSDYDIAAGPVTDRAADSAATQSRPTRASSDPSISAVDNILPRPVEPPPRHDMHPHQLPYDPRYVCTCSTTHTAQVSLPYLTLPYLRGGLFTQC